MTPRRYGPLAYVPIHRRRPLTWPNGARVALWVNPNVEFFGLDDVMPSNLNDHVANLRVGYDGHPVYQVNSREFLRVPRS